MRIGISLGITRQGAASGLPTPTDGPATVGITDFTRDNWLYDSGAVFGNNSASVPLSGTANEDGKPIYARWGTSGPWQEVSSGAVAGNWSGTLSLPRTTTYDVVQVLQADGSTAATTNKVGSGHDVHAWGQSWKNRIYPNGSVDPGNATSIPLTNPGQVQFITQADSAFEQTTPVPVRIMTGVDNIGDGTAEFVNHLASLNNDLWCITSIARGATGWSDLVDDTDDGVSTERRWSDDKTLVDYAMVDGRHPGFIDINWWSNQGQAVPSNNIEDLAYRMVFGITPDGAVFDPATDNPLSSGLRVDHSMTEFYDYTKAKVGWSGPIPTASQGSAALSTPTVRVDTGFDDPFSRGMENGRKMMRRMAADPNVSSYLTPLGADFANIQLGRASQYGSGADLDHPSDTDLDGNEHLRYHTAENMLFQMGLSSPISAIPEFTGSTWTSGYVELDATHTVTTVRNMRGEAAIAAPLDHHQTVMGVELLNEFHDDVRIVGGKVRAYPTRASGVFTANDTHLLVMGGAATGGYLELADLQKETWKNLPVADVGLPDRSDGKERGLLFRGFPSPALLKNDLPLAPGSVTKTASDQVFSAPTGSRMSHLFRSVSREAKYTIEATMTIPSSMSGISGRQEIISWTGGGTVMTINPSNRELRASVAFQTAAGTDFVNRGLAVSGGDSFSYDEEFTLLMQIDATDHTAGTKTLSLRKGSGSMTEILSEAQTYTEAMRFVDTSLPRYMFGSTTGYTVRSIREWADTGTDSVSVPNNDNLIMCLSGSAIYLNDHSWKQGADFT